MGDRNIQETLGLFTISTPAQSKDNVDGLTVQKRVKKVDFKGVRPKLPPKRGLPAGNVE